MKSFRHIAILLGLAALFAGCVKTEIVDAPAKEITFTVGGYAPATRASSLESNGITSFKAHGFLHAQGYESTTQDFFGVNGETITKQGNEWAPASHPYYWPKSEFSYVNFVCWYDKNGGTPTTVSETRLEWTNRTIAYNDDIMYADEAWRFNDNLTNAAQYDGDAITTGVPVLFHHALSQVKFQARLSEAVEGDVSWTVTISNFRINNVHKTGSLSLSNSEPETSFTTNPWTNTGWTLTEAVDTLSHAGQYTLGAANQVIMNTRSVLPQSTFGMELTFDYSINTTYNIDGNPLQTVSENSSATVNLFNDFRIYNWEANTRVTYTLVFNPKTSKILFDPVLTEGWNTDLNNSIYIE